VLVCGPVLHFSWSVTTKFLGAGSFISSFLLLGSGGKLTF